MKAQIFLGLLAFGVGFIAQPSFAQSNRDINNRLQRIENEIETLGRAVYRGEEPPPGAFAGSGGSAADTEVRIQGFESQIRELTGKIEEQDYQIRQLQQQLEKLSADIDIRMQGGGFTGTSTDTGGGFINNPVRTPANQYENPPQPTPQLTPEPSDGGYQWQSGANADGQLGTYSESNGAAAGDTAASLYESAFSLLKSAQYDEAEKEFRSFLSQYPGHALTGNATYWLGETYYVRGQFEKAAKTFAEGYQKDPKGAKAADNLLKMGMSLSGMGKKNDACVALGQIEKEFSASAGPVLRRAQLEMTRLGC